MMTHAFITPHWPAPSAIKAYCTTRLHGYSQGVFTSLNTAYHVGDDPAQVEHNRAYINTTLALPATPAWLNQVHGKHAVNANLRETTPKADASYANQVGSVCVIQTADCLPILITNQQGTEVAAIHAGWRSLAANIIPATIAHLTSQSNQLLAWLGPAISQVNYEIGDEVRNAFITRNLQAQTAFTPSANGRWLADLYTIARQDLQRAGITAIYGGKYCTFAQKDLFFSYRRDGQTGRMASLIWISNRL